MTQKPADVLLQKKLKKASQEIISIFEKNDFDLEQCCALLGGIFAFYADQTEHQLPFIALLYSFINVSRDLRSAKELEEKEIIDSL
jgi:hypothetical protein